MKTAKEHEADTTAIAADEVEPSGAANAAAAEEEKKPEAYKAKCEQLPDARRGDYFVDVTNSRRQISDQLVSFYNNSDHKGIFGDRAPLALRYRKSPDKVRETARKITSSAEQRVTGKKDVSSQTWQRMCSTFFRG